MPAGPPLNTQLYLCEAGSGQASYPNMLQQVTIQLYTHIFKATICLKFREDVIYPQKSFLKHIILDFLWFVISVIPRFCVKMCSLLLT